MLLTLGEAKQSRMLRISGVCADSEDFVDLVNDGTRELINRGSWWGTVQTCNACVYGRTVAWNRYVGTVLAMNVCGRPTVPANMWYDFTPAGTDEVRGWAHHWNRNHRCNVEMVNVGTSPVFNQLDPNNPAFLQVFVTDERDVGKTITFYGLDSNMLPVLSKRPDGTIQPGMQVTMGLPSATTSPIAFARVDRVHRDQTNGRVFVFQINPANGNQFPLATYEPTETDPAYQVTRLPEFRRFITQPTLPGTNSTPRPQMVSALVKLEFVPVVNDNDLIVIGNIDALAKSMQAVKIQDSYDVAGAEAAFVTAVRTLNHELKEKFPVEQTTVSFRPFGTATLSRQHLGMI